MSEFVDGKGRPLVGVSGPALNRLRPSARRRLASVMLGTPRRSRLSTPSPVANSLVAYVAMAEAPEGVAVRSFRAQPDGPSRAAAGVASADGGGLALVVGRPDRPGCVLEVYGEGAGAGQAERSLEGLVQRWRSAGRPSLADCEVTVTYGALSPTGATVANHHGSFTVVRWPS